MPAPSIEITYDIVKAEDGFYVLQGFAGEPPHTRIGPIPDRPSARRVVDGLMEQAKRLLERATADLMSNLAQTKSPEN